MLTQSAEVRRLVLARLNPGDDLLLSLAEAVRQQNIQGGVILNGIGASPNGALRHEVRPDFHVLDDMQECPAQAPDADIEAARCWRG